MWWPGSSPSHWQQLLTPPPPCLAWIGPLYLTHQQLSGWLDRIPHPTIHRNCKAHYTQHLPTSYEHALCNSRAHQVEERLVDAASYQSQWPFPTIWPRSTWNKFGPTFSTPSPIS